MNLAQSNQRPFLLAATSTKFLQEGSTIAFDRTAGILFGESEVERGSPICAGKSPDPRAESMNEPWNASQVFGTKDGQSSFVGTLDGHSNILTIKPGSISGFACANPWPARRHTQAAELYLLANAGR